MYGQVMMDDLNHVNRKGMMEQSLVWTIVGVMKNGAVPNTQMFA